MPRTNRIKLTTSLCRTLGTGEHADSEVHRLYLRVTKSGARTFTLRYRTLSGRQRRMTLGTFGALTLDAARGLARDLLARVARGEDPAADKTALRAEPTVADLVGEYIAEKGRTLAASTITNYGYALRDYITPALGSLKVSEVTRDDVQAAYRKWSQRSEARAINAHRLLRAALNHAKRRGTFKGENPAMDVETGKIRKVERLLSPDERSRLWQAFEEASKRPGVNPAAVDALKVACLCGSRKTAMARLWWSEVNLETGVVQKDPTNPGSKRLKTIVLPPAALEIVRRRVKRGSPSSGCSPASVTLASR